MLLDFGNEVAAFGRCLAKCGVIVYIVDEHCSFVYPSNLIAQGPWASPLEDAYENFRRALDGESFSLAQTIAKRHVDVRYEPITNFDGHVVGAVATLIDLTEHENRVAELAMRDPLTGLANRRLLSQELTDAKSRTDRGSQGFGMHLIDLDYFKEVNDSYGHLAGDEVLRQVGERLRRCTRNTDVPARLGGDEFAIIQHNVKDADDCGMMAEKVISALCQPYEIPNVANPIRIGASIGIAIYPGDAESPDELMDNADLALYESKASGKKQFQFFEVELQEAVKAKMQMARDIQAALVEGQFYLNFQPIVALDSHKSKLAEVLLRWEHPEKGTISPAEFIPVAEESGTIIAITYYVIQQLCIHIEQMGEAAKDMQFAVNLPGQILKEDFVSRLQCILRAHGVDPSQMKLEITEHTALKDTARIQQTMQRLTDLGFDFAIDDFGTGYSSLRNLQTFNFKKVKIDKCFVDRIDCDSGREVVRSIIEISKSMGLEVVAEGVETPQQLAFLQAHGCDCGQGYLWSKPLDFARFQDYMVAARNVEDWPDTWADTEAAMGLNERKDN